jgi:hypothetical protein
VFTVRLSRNGRETRGRDQAAARIARFGALAHVGRGVFEGVVCTIQIHGQHPPPFLGGHLIETITVPPGTGVGETRIDTAVLSQRCFERTCDGGGVGDVTLLSRCSRAESLQPVQRGGVLLRIGSPETDIRARLGDAFGDAQANAAIAAGDQRNLAAEVERCECHDWVTSISMVGRCARRASVAW